MIKVEKIDVWGFEHAIRGMRNPMNSWDKSDTLLCGNVDNPDLILGKNDLDLMKRLYKQEQNIGNISDRFLLVWILPLRFIGGRKWIPIKLAQLLTPVPLCTRLPQKSLNWMISAMSI